MKWSGIGAIVAGSVALYLSGVQEQGVIAIVGAVFVLAGVVASILKS